MRCCALRVLLLIVRCCTLRMLHFAYVIVWVSSPWAGGWDKKKPSLAHLRWLTVIVDVRWGLQFPHGPMCAPNTWVNAMGAYCTHTSHMCKQRGYIHMTKGTAEHNSTLVLARPCHKSPQKHSNNLENKNEYKKYLNVGTFSEFSEKFQNMFRSSQPIYKTIVNRNGSFWQTDLDSSCYFFFLFVYLDFVFTTKWAVSNYNLNVLRPMTSFTKSKC